MARQRPLWLPPQSPLQGLILEVHATAVAVALPQSWPYSLWRDLLAHLSASHMDVSRGFHHTLPSSLAHGIFNVEKNGPAEPYGFLSLLQRQSFSWKSRSRIGCSLFGGKGNLKPVEGGRNVPCSVAMVCSVSCSSYWRTTCQHAAAVLASRRDKDSD
jgi:hypothetical protein